MDDVTRLITRFDSEDTGGLENRDKSIKPGVIESLEAHAADPRVLDFLLRVASDRNEFDLARIEALKVLEVWEHRSDEERRRVASVLKVILEDDPDDDVRQYAAMAAAYCMSERDLVEVIVARAFDESEDINLRWNAFAAIKQLGPTPEGIRLIRTATASPAFRTSALRILGEWGAV